MSRTLLLILLLITSNLHLYAQQKQGQERIDSLLASLRITKEDTNKVNILNDLAFEAGITTGNSDTAITYAKEAIALSERINYQKGKAIAYSTIGMTLYYKDNYPEALDNYIAAQKIYKTIDYKKGIAASYNNIGNVCYGYGNYPEALKNFFSAIKIYESIKDTMSMAKNYNNIGNVYTDQKNFIEALKYFRAALQINTAMGNANSIALNYNNIGNLYINQGDYNAALQNFSTALQINEANGNTRNQVMNYSNIGEVYLRVGNYPEALKNYSKALEINEIMGDKLGASLSHRGIGAVYNLLQQPDEAKKWLLKGIKLAKEMGNKPTIATFYKELASSDSIQGSFNAAYENYKLYVLYKDSVYNEEATRKTLQAKMQYEFDKKEAIAKAEQDKKNSIARMKLQRQKTLTYIGAGTVLALMGFSIFIFRNNKLLGKEKQKSEDLLLNILPEEISNELKERGATTARQFDEVTVMFTDFVNFTGAGEKMGTQKLVEELHTCFKAFDEIIGKYNIEKIKTIGDAYLAVSGLPVPDNRHAENIMNAALEISAFTQSRRKMLGDNTFEIRIGIHSGPVVAGIVGVKKFAYDIWGDTVNTAARMEQNSEPGKINISQTTYELIRDKYTCSYRGEIEAKNKGMMNMYFVEVTAA